MAYRKDLERSALMMGKIKNPQIRSVETLQSFVKQKNGEEKIKSTYRSDIEDTIDGESTYVITKENKRGKVTDILINPDNTGYKDITTSKGKKRGHKTSKIINKARVENSKQLLGD